MSWEIESNHVALLPHTLIVHYAMVLPAVTACGVQKDDVLVAGARLLIEDLHTH